MNAIKNIIDRYEEIAKIPDKLYEGYYWPSDESKPVVLLNEKLDKSVFKTTSLPFIVEAHLYAKEEQISIHVKYIDGKYWITQTNLNIEYGSIRDTTTYIAHDIEKEGKKINYFQMIEAWQAESKKHLAEMETLSPAWTAFVGFGKGE